MAKYMEHHIASSRNSMEQAQAKSKSKLSGKIGHTLERIYDFHFTYIIWFLVVYLTYFMKLVKEMTFSSKVHKVFFANIRNDCVFSIIKKMSNATTQSESGHSTANSFSFTNNLKA